MTEKTSWKETGSMSNLHPHQIATLASELADAAYHGLSADEAYELVTSPDVANRLARTRYADVAGFSTGAPGFPNKVRRADFDNAWTNRS